MPEVRYRRAELDDARDILALLLEVAPEIPLQVEPLEREEALYSLVRSCARSGESWIATDEAGRLIGFLLVEPNQARRHYAENEVLDLRYGGVAATHRNRGIFTAIVKQALARMLPLTVSVGPTNRSGAARLFEKLGFRQVSSSSGEQQYRWEPGVCG